MVRAIKSGKLRFRVNIQRVTQTVDAVGQPGESWATLATVWADINSYSSLANGREFTQADAIAANVSHIVKMRYYAGLTPKDRIQYGSRIFEIVSLANTDERNRETVAYVLEAV